MSLLEFNNIKLKIDDSDILKGVSFSVDSGNVHAIIGDNGAGKTSLLRIILGLTPEYEGNITVLGSKGINSYRRCMGSVMDSILPDNRRSGRSYLHNVCYMLGTNDESFEHELLEKVGLNNDSNKVIGKYSLGMKRRLMIACALAGKPELLVLDEPFNGIDPNGMNDMRLLLQRLKSEGVTVLITSHIITELIKVADSFSIMYKGLIVDTISATALSAAQYSKVILKPESIALLIDKIHKYFPKLYCVASSENTVSIYNTTITEFNNLIQTTKEFQILNMEQEVMSEEDILLWKMNGHQI